MSPSLLRDHIAGLFPCVACLTGVVLTRCKPAPTITVITFPLSGCGTSITGESRLHAAGGEDAEGLTGAVINPAPLLHASDQIVARPLARYLSLPDTHSKTIAAWKKQTSSDGPTYLAVRERLYEGLRKAGMPQQ